MAVWADGVWADGVWATGVWAEDAASGVANVSSGFMRTKDASGFAKGVSETADQLAAAIASGGGENITDLWMEYLAEQGHTTGSINDRFLDWLRNTKGVTAAGITDATRKWDGTL